jgi:predicted Zn-dependent protease with MMP-like domain
MTLGEFSALVADVTNELPDECLRAIADVEITVEDAPTPEELERLSIPPDALLRGFYSRFPHASASMGLANLAPAPMIRLFREALELCGQYEGGTRESVRQTLIHEIAHHFNISHERMKELGYA